MDKIAHISPAGFMLTVFQIRIIQLSAMLLIVMVAISPVGAQTPLPIRYVLGNSVPAASTLPNGLTMTMKQCIGQGSAIGTFYNNGYVLRQGFIQPTKNNFTSKVSNQLQATIFPNPASGNMTINLTEPITGPITVNLFDLCGKILFTNNFPVTQEIKLDYQPLASGIYIMELKSGNQYYSTKLIID